MQTMQMVRVIDTHTGGEPTRVVVSGGPDLGTGDMAQRRQLFRDRFDEFRSAVVNEPRGSDVMVGALLCEPVDPSAAAGVIFFNNVGPLWMCGHGTIGVAVALAHLGRIQPGPQRLETAVGTIGFELHDQARVTLENVPAYRYRQNVQVAVPDFGTVNGDIVWGGNWFFLVKYDREMTLQDVETLTEFTWKIRQELQRQQITGAEGGEIDHIELNGPPLDPHNHGRNFVLCPGKAYDRSPCGTGTSAKLASLFTDGKLRAGEIWRQESIIGSVFEGSVRCVGDAIIPCITGSAYVNAEANLLLNPHDPFVHGIR